MAASKIWFSFFLVPEQRKVTNTRTKKELQFPAENISKPKTTRNEKNMLGKATPKSSLCLLSYSRLLPSWALVIALCWHRDPWFTRVQETEVVGVEEASAAGWSLIQLCTVWNHHGIVIFWSDWKPYALNCHLKSSFDSLNTSGTFSPLRIFVGREVFK